MSNRTCWSAEFCAPANETAPLRRSDAVLEKDYPEKTNTLPQVGTTILAAATVAELAEKHGVREKVLRGRLDRWRKYHDSCFREVTGRKPREPKYLYDEA